MNPYQLNKGSTLWKKTLQGWLIDIFLKNIKKKYLKLRKNFHSKWW